jgi:hypothetical protein
MKREFCAILAAGLLGAAATSIAPVHAADDKLQSGSISHSLLDRRYSQAKISIRFPKKCKKLRIRKDRDRRKRAALSWN